MNLFIELVWHYTDDGYEKPLVLGVISSVM